MININFYSGKMPYDRPTLDEFIHKYNELYIKGTELFTEFDICDIQDNTCQRGRADNVASFCCSGCQYLADSGCIAKSIWCKLWLCNPGKAIANKIPEFVNRHKELIAQAGRLCRGNAGRYDISDYTYQFYSKAV
jgi:hypothetical protein